MAGLTWFVYRTKFGIAIRATAEDVRVALGKAATAQARWAARAPRERATVFDRFRALLVEHREQLMDVIQAETGKARWAAQEEG